MHTNRLPRSFARARIRARPLAAHGQPAAVADAPIAVDRLQPFQVALNLTSKIALDRQFTRGDRLDNLIELLVAKILCPRVGADIHLLEDPLRGARADAVNVGQRRFDALVARDINAKESGRGFLVYS